MFHPRHAAIDERRHFYRRVAIAPLCLVLVAGLHLVRVAGCNQTPWKGGGFGMFSTVDSESARYLRCYLVTDRGEIPCEIPASLAKRAAEVRAAPTQAALNELATRLARLRYRWRDEHQRRELVRLAAATASPPFVGQEHVIELADDDDPESLAISAVRVEAWRFCFDRHSGQLRGESLLESRVPRAEGRP